MGGVAMVRHVASGLGGRHPSSLFGEPLASGIVGWSASPGAAVVLLRAGAQTLQKSPLAPSHPSLSFSYTAIFTGPRAFLRTVHSPPKKKLGAAPVPAASSLSSELGASASFRFGIPEKKKKHTYQACRYPPRLPAARTRPAAVSSAMCAARARTATYSESTLARSATLTPHCLPTRVAS